MTGPKPLSKEMLRGRELVAGWLRWRGLGPGAVTVLGSLDVEELDHFIADVIEQIRVRIREEVGDVAYEKALAEIEKDGER